MSGEIIKDVDELTFQGDFKKAGIEPPHYSDQELDICCKARE